MTLKIGDTAPDFQAHATEQPIRFHDWIDGSWAVLLRDAVRRDLRRGELAADIQTVRNVFVVGPDKTPKLILVYPMTTGRSFDGVLRVIDSPRMTARHTAAAPVNGRQDEDVIISGSVSDEEPRKLFDEWEAPRPCIRIVRQPGRRGLLAVSAPELEWVDGGAR